MDLPSARVFVTGLLVGCPYEPNPKECALYDIRKKPMEKRIEWSKQLTDEQIQSIIKTHRECLDQRTKRGKLAVFNGTQAEDD